MKREKCMYGFQFRIFMRSRHSGGPRRVRQQGGEGRPERILCYASIEKWADQESVGGPEGAGPAVYMSNLHFQYFLLGRKHQLSSLPSRHSPCSVWNGIARLQDCEERLLEFFFGILIHCRETSTQFLETWAVLVLLSSSPPSLAMHDRPSGIYFRKSFLPCEPPPRRRRSTLENKEQLENAGRERMRGSESVEKRGER